MDKAKSAVVCDVINLVLGAFLFLTPWLFASTPGVGIWPGAEGWNNWIAGIVIAALSIAALLSFAEWEEWLNLIIGLWVIVSPWALDFAGHTAAMWSNVVVGVIFATVAAIEIWLQRGAALHVTHTR
jgi:hypothetical protein